MPRYKLTIEYDGTNLAGWQRQDGVPTVQQYTEEAVSKYFDTEERFVVQCSGRTDAGVHAHGQVAHVDLPEAREEFSVAQGITHHLSTMTSQVVIRKAERVDDSFHARFGAKERSYQYRIFNRKAPLAIHRHRAWQVAEPLDEQAMHKAAQLLLGEHDFSSFRDSQCQSNSPIKSIDSITIIREGDEILTQLKARSFLHHQVRIIMGSLRKVGNGKWTEADLQNVIEAKDRKAAGETAPAYGLYFMNVQF